MTSPSEAYPLSGTDFLSRLPAETVYHVFRHEALATIARCKRLDRRMNLVLSDPHFPSRSLDHLFRSCDTTKLESLLKAFAASPTPRTHATTAPFLFSEKALQQAVDSKHQKDFLIGLGFFPSLQRCTKVPDPIVSPMVDVIAREYYARHIRSNKGRIDTFGRITHWPPSRKNWEPVMRYLATFVVPESNHQQAVVLDIIKYVTTVENETMILRNLVNMRVLERESCLSEVWRVGLPEIIGVIDVAKKIQFKGEG
ncbi:hypothetical protein BC830DRAFT_1141830 [Chytriomyces sp. MP71]|nr:hypothetical protein BC830DRAFT_1141830 [Chytriomyces sp. MP71]